MSQDATYKMASYESLRPYTSPVNGEEEAGGSVFFVASRFLTPLVAIGITTVLFCSGALAQPSDRRGDRVLEAAAMERDAREMVEVMMMVRISRELKLTEEETVLLVRRAGETRDELNKLNRERRALMSDVRAAMTEKMDEEEILARLEKLKEHDRRLSEAKLNMHEKLGEGLDAKQQVRLYMFLQEFEQNMRNMIQRVRERSRMLERGRMGREGPPPSVRERVQNRSRPESRESGDESSRPKPETTPERR